MTDPFSTDLFWVLGPDGELDSTAPTFMGATMAQGLRAAERRVARSRMRILFPPDAVLPVCGGGTLTARELGLPLTTDPPATKEPK